MPDNKNTPPTPPSKIIKDPSLDEKLILYNYFKGLNNRSKLNRTVRDKINGMLAPTATIDAKTYNDYIDILMKWAKEFGFKCEGKQSPQQLLCELMLKKMEIKQKIEILLKEIQDEEAIINGVANVCVNTSTTTSPKKIKNNRIFI
ncbi:hypothetical protein CYY_000498 [Polysphondylium violaceum]|uniref:Uncharacterized protein n=1 Tax=Polysphondylium violaceum TaxID=133409 RepID=A0A8J4V5J5_9MYCE|nr:hypothetical protein CYY_000498 [Polysphondylium violaceum]